MQGIELTRRELLAGTAGAGGTGVLLGTGTGALLADGELFDGVFASGVLDLAVEWADGEKSSEDGLVAIEIDESDGEQLLSVALPGDRNTSGYGWLRTVCPAEPLPTFADDMGVRLSYAGCGGDEVVIADGSAAEVGRQLRSGIPLDPRCVPPDDVTLGEQPCLHPGDGGGVDLLFEWSWDLDADCHAGPLNLFAFDFVAEQCRHDDGTENPFPEPSAVRTCETVEERHGISFVEIYADVDGDGCSDDADPVGKVELEPRGCYDQPGIEENLIEPGRYDLSEDVDQPCDDTGYDVVVTDTETKDCGTETVGVAFQLVEDGTDSGPDLCEVRIKGGRDTVVYDSGFVGNATGGLLYAPERSGR
jgi:hypothetical protein